MGRNRYQEPVDAERTSIPIKVKAVLDVADALLREIDRLEHIQHEAIIDGILADSGKWRSSLLKTVTTDRAEAIAAYDSVGGPDFSWEDRIGKRGYWPNDDKILKTKEDVRQDEVLRYMGYPPSFRRYCSSRQGTRNHWQHKANPITITKDRAEKAKALNLSEVWLDRDLYNQFLDASKEFAPSVSAPSSAQKDLTA